jgi:hypothetical protein
MSEVGKLKPARGSLPGLPKSSAGNFKVGDIGYFENAPDARWLSCDGSQITSAAYPDLVKLLTANKNPMMQMLTISGTVPSGVVSGAIAISPDGVYVAVPADTSGTNGINLYKNVGDVITFLAAYLTATNPICRMAWSPDGQFLAVTNTANTTCNILKRTGDTLALVATCQAAASAQVIWVANDYLVLTNPSGSPYLYCYTFNGVSTFTLQANPSVSGTFSAMQMTSAGTLVMVSTSYFYFYQRSGNTLTQLGTIGIPDANAVIDGYMGKFGMYGDANILIVGARASSAYSYLVILTKDPTGWTYTKRTVNIGTPSFGDILLDMNKQYLYCLIYNAVTPVLEVSNGAVNPIATLSDYVLNSSNTSFFGAIMNTLGKYIAFCTSSYPYFGVIKELSSPLGKATLPIISERTKLGKRVYPFMKAKS